MPDPRDVSDIGAAFERVHTDTLAGDHLKYRYLSRRSCYPLRRSAEELSFAFSVLLTQPLSRPEAAVRFETLWNEVNDAAQSCVDSDAAFSYIALLHRMDRRWRFLPSMN
ncbi:hypothetical protein SAMN05192539_1001122 [Paraburkholderia diazotrophica]|uniref:Uncharacterized protein n=1 Tax=Paraburkholderia diazotrophica TaxID=667676 RepID=A0A1H6Q5P2_9BURK|nr:hypothetical protein SAMN05192539_1001122 [Paraburkholderia diazotrophica]